MKLQKWLEKQVQRAEDRVRYEPGSMLGDASKLNKKELKRAKKALADYLLLVAKYKNLCADDFESIGWLNRGD